MKKNLFLILFFFVSCVEYSTISEGQYGRISIDPKGHKVDEVEVVDWKVGPQFRQTISKGIRVIIHFPVFEEDKWISLVQKKKATSWLIRVSKKDFNGTHYLGLIDFPFISTQGHQLVHLPKSAFYSVYYADAAMSLRFENMMCPAFHNQKELSGIKIHPTYSSGTGHIVLDSAEERYIEDKVTVFNHYTMVLNGGNSLLGEYDTEIALYNHQTKKVLGPFLKLPQSVIVESENEKPIAGCNNFTPPPRPKERTLEGFKFKH